MITRYKSALRFAGLLLLCLNAAACANILGIDEPVVRSDDVAGSSGVSGSSGSPEAGAAGEGDNASRGFPKLQVNGAVTGQVGTPSHLVIDGPLAVSGCPDSPATIDLSVNGGEGKYSWEIDPPDPTFVLKAVGANREQAVLTGSVGTKARTLSVRATDKNGASSLITTDIKVASVPVIEPPVIGSVCADELYALDLHASGGDEQHYVWSSNDLPASSGLAISADGHLTGKFSGIPSGPSQLKFSIQVADGTACVAAPMKVSLTVNGAGATECPAIGISGQLQTRPLPPLCLGGEYNQQLKATGGTAPYTWTHGALPSGLSLDSTGKISGTYVTSAPKPVPPASFAVQVTDQLGRRIERNELVPVREKCWFAYVAQSGGTTQLNFFDPLLGNRKTPPNQESGEAVKDFKFSPNGRFVAYRLTLPAGTTWLSVIDLSTWQQNTAAFAGVTNYAWSSNSGTLAVAYSVGTDTVLGGLDVAHPLPGNGSLVVFPTLSSVITSIKSGLAWFGPDPEQLALITNVSGFSVLKTFSLDSSPGFGSPVLQTDDLTDGTWLKPAKNGVFAIPQVFEILFYPSDGSFPAYHDNVIVAPSGQYVARAESGSLNAFRPIDDSTDTPPFSNVGCDRIASWAYGRERIACAHQTSNAVGELTFFDIAAGSNPNSVELNATANVPFQIPLDRRRLFSPSGSVFAFASDQDVTIATLSQVGQTTHVTGDVNPTAVSATAPGKAFAELSFAPNEKLLLQHRSSRLSFFDLSDATSPEVTISDALPTSLACDEDFRKVQTSGAGWCGAERLDGPFWWSPNSDVAAFQNADGTLHIYAFGPRSASSVDDQCGQGCVVPGQVNFQP